MSSRVNGSLAAAAILLAIGALAAGDIERLDEVAATQQIAVLDLAARIRDREPLLLVDLRDDTVGFRLPGAMSLAEAGARVAGEPTTPIVVYGYEGTRRWTRLRGGGREILFLADGVQRWLDEIIEPVLYRDAPEAERRAFERQAALSRYFGGVPRISDVPIVRESEADRLASLRRRGCGF